MNITLLSDSYLDKIRQTQPRTDIIKSYKLFSKIGKSVALNKSNFSGIFVKHFQSPTLIFVITKWRMHLFVLKLQNGKRQKYICLNLHRLIFFVLTLYFDALFWCFILMLYFDALFWRFILTLYFDASFQIGLRTD